MIADKFAVILQDLSKHLSLNLKPDENNSCLIVIQEKLEIQLELDPTEEFLIIGSILGELPPGKFREDCLMSALKSNAKPYPRMGNFAYSRKINSLVLFEKLELSVFSVENMLSVFTPFIKKAMNWADALDQGRSSPAFEEDYLSESDPSVYFGR